MPSTPQPLYPMFIKWMPFHIPILFLMYAFIVMKLLNYFKIIEISFDVHNQKSTILNIIVLLVCYQLIMACIIHLYKKVLLLKIHTLQHSGSASMQEFESHKKLNTQYELQKLQKEQQFLQWKKQQLQKQSQQNTLPKVIYQSHESSSEEQVEPVSEHRLATTKKIF